MEHSKTTKKAIGLAAGLLAAGLCCACKPPAVSDDAGAGQAGTRAPATSSAPAPPAPSAAPTSSPPAAPAMTSVPLDLDALAREFRELRAIKGHFSGGQWNDAVDKAGGRKVTVMGELGKKLGDGTRTKAEVEALMGPPDTVFPRGHMMFGRAYRGGDARVKELLVYHWRGMRDVLFFATDGTRVLSSGWWSALE